jgi:hypothetical protein
MNALAATVALHQEAWLEPALNTLLKVFKEIHLTKQVPSNCDDNAKSKGGGSEPKPPQRGFAFKSQTSMQTLA